MSANFPLSKEEVEQLETQLLAILHQRRLDWAGASDENGETAQQRFTEALQDFHRLVLDGIPTEAIDTTTPAGRMMMQMIEAFAEFERAMFRERTKARVEASRREVDVGQS